MTKSTNEEKKLRREQRAQKFKRFVWRVFSSIESAFFPENITCDVCGEELVADTRYNLCAECISQLTVTGDHVCLVCGVPIADEAEYCLRCQNSKREFLLNRSPLVYEGKAQKLILQMKFGGKRYIAKTLGAMMSDEFLKRRMNAEIAVFVPMTEAAEKKRGFNQSELLAREIADRLNLPLLPALIKTRETSSQKTLTMNEREQNLVGAYECVFKEIKGRKILLIDDVYTTGATANACAHALLKAGAKQVSVLTAAVTKKKIQFEGGEKEEQSLTAD